MSSYTPQQAHEAESAILGAVFLDNNVMDDIGELLEPRDFTIAANELIWKGMQYNYRRNRPIDLVTIVEMLKRYDRLEEVGGVGYISLLSYSCPSAANVRHYVDIVRSAAYRRRGVEVATKIMELAQGHTYESDEEYFQELERLANGVRPGTNGDMKHVSETKDEYFRYLATKDDFIYSGFKSFDDWMGGYGRGWLIIKAGRPSVGKTAKVLQEAVGIAKQNVGEVLIWSQEMKRNQLFNRMLPGLTGVNGNRIRRKELEDHELESLRKGYDTLSNLPLHIEDAKNVTIDEVRATARQFKRKYGRIGAIIVDYLTIMKIVQQKGETRSQAVGYVTRTAKQVALEMDCPFIMLAQLNRAGTDEPKLEHLRDSGEIEQDADVVELLWHNPEETNQNGKVITSIIAKGRDVGVNQFKYLFKGWIQRYEELA
jgi:replicative DNA helicase